MDQLIEIIAILSGITSVWFSKKENIWVYPTGLVGTMLYVYISFQGELYGEATVNLYYTIMSLYGWYNWLRRDQQKELIVHITRSSQREWIIEIGFFISLYLIIYFALTYIKQAFSPGAIPWADALASASAFTGMWLMTRKSSTPGSGGSSPTFAPSHFIIQRLYLNFMVLFHPAHPGHHGMDRMEKKANEQAA